MKPERASKRCVFLAWCVAALLALPGSGWAAGNSPNGQNLNGGQNPGSPSGATPANTPPPATGNATLIAETKSTAFGAIETGMGEIATEIKGLGCPVIFNSPISLQDVATISVIDLQITKSTAEAKRAYKQISPGGDIDETIAKIQKQISQYKPNGINKESKLVIPPGVASQILESGSLASSIGTVFNTLTSIISEIQTFKNQVTNNAGAITLDSTTVNSIFTVELKHKGVDVYDLSKAIPEADDLNPDNLELYKHLSALLDAGTELNDVITSGTVRLDNDLGNVKTEFKALPYPSTDAQKDSYNQIKTLIAKVDTELYEVGRINGDCQQAIKTLMTQTVANTNGGPQTPVAGGTGGAPQPVQTLITNPAPAAGYLMAAWYLQLLHKVGSGSSGTGCLFVTCRLVSADATETSVNRYLLENYTTSSAISTIEVDAFDLTGECKYGALIENRGTNLYWYSRVKDAAQFSPRMFGVFGWPFIPRVRQPQFAITREISSAPNIETNAGGTRRDFYASSKYADFFAGTKTKASDELAERIDDLLKDDHPLNNWQIARKLGQDPDVVRKCIEAHGYNNQKCGFYFTSAGFWRWNIVDTKQSSRKQEDNTPTSK